jgi:hypothetical protein
MSLQRRPRSSPSRSPAERRNGEQDAVLLRHGMLREERDLVRLKRREVA